MLMVSRLYCEAALVLCGAHVSAAQVSHNLLRLQLDQRQRLTIIGCDEVHLSRICHCRVIDLLLRLIQTVDLFLVEIFLLDLFHILRA